MLKKLTINVNEDVYSGLHQVIGQGRISQFLENLARPYVTQIKKISPREGLGCTGYKGPALKDTDIPKAVAAHIKRKWSKKSK